MRGRLYPVEDDWCEWRQEPALPGTVLVQVTADPRGRLILTGLRIEGAPTAELLRAIPVGRIEAAANAQLSVVDDAIVAAAPPGRRNAPAAREPHLSDDGWEAPDPLRAALRRSRPVSMPRTGTRRPDDFYRGIARAYLDLAQTSARPAAELAETHHVPATTAHRWIKEARRRGFLPPGRPGKAG
jgi:hypothetical protein